MCIPASGVLGFVSVKTLFSQTEQNVARFESLKQLHIIIIAKYVYPYRKQTNKSLTVYFQSVMK